MTVHCFSTGTVRGKRRERGVRRYLPGGWRDDTLPVNVFLVEHRDGLCLFDTGQTVGAARPGHFPRWYPFFRLARFELDARDEAGAQLQRRGIDPSTVRWVVLSHLHTDHVGGLDAFSRARVLVAREEWARATGLGGRLRGYLPQYWPGQLDPSLVEFDDGPVGPFGGSRRLTDDGRLVLVPTPGHTPGHMALIVQAGDRRFLLCGDMAHTAAELERTAPEIARYCRGAGVTPLTAHDPQACAVIAH